LLALVSCGDQGGSAVELIDDLEDLLLPLLGRDVRREQSPDSQVRLDALLLRDQRIGGLLNAIVDKLVGARQALNQLLTDGLPQSRVDLLRRGSENDRKHGDLGHVAETRQLL
jgi:hypothetical protein